MPRGPNGEWRPADPIAAAVHVGKIATGQIEETFANRRAGTSITRKRVGARARPGRHPRTAAHRNSGQPWRRLELRRGGGSLV